MGHGGSPAERSSDGEQESHGDGGMVGKVPWAYTHPRKAPAFLEVARGYLATCTHGAQRHSLGGGHLQQRERPEEKHIGATCGSGGACRVEERWWRQE